MRQNFYSGRYNPYRYAQQGESEIYSMYNPEAEDKFLQAVAGRQERFDTAVGAVAQEKARIGDLETYDPNLLEKKISDFEEGITDVVQNKYKGDYSAAAPELVSMIAKERSHPFYRYNKQKVQAVDQYNQMRQQLGANFLSTKNPAQVGFDEWQQGADFGFTPINRNDIVKNSEAVFSNLSKTLRDAGLSRSANQPFIQSIIQYGFQDEDQVRDFLQTPEGQAMVNQIQASMPELANLDQNVVMDAIQQGAYSAIGQTRIDYMQNPDYIPIAAREADNVPEGANPIIPAGYAGIDIKDKEFITNPAWRTEANEAARELGKELGLEDISSVDDLMEVRKDSQKFSQLIASKALFGNIPGIGDVITSKLSDIEQKQITGDALRRRLVDKMKDRYGSPDTRIMTWKFSDIASANPDMITDIKKINTQINSSMQKGFSILRDQEAFEPVEKTSKDNLKQIEDDIQVQEFAMNPEAGLMLGITGTTKDDESKSARVFVQDPGTVAETVGYISDLKPSILPSFVNYLSTLLESNPDMYNTYIQIIRNNPSLYNKLALTTQQ
jgi:hypothetical protein